MKCFCCLNLLGDLDLSVQLHFRHGQGFKMMRSHSIHLSLIKCSWYQVGKALSFKNQTCTNQLHRTIKADRVLKQLENDKIPSTGLNRAFLQTYHLVWSHFEYLDFNNQQSIDSSLLLFNAVQKLYFLWFEFISSGVNILI